MREKKYKIKRNGLIYIVTDNVFKKQYIGQTITGLEKRKNKHLNEAYNPGNIKHYTSIFYKMIRFLGKENFTWEILEDNIPYSDLDEKEIFYIEKYDTYLNGYNSGRGGQLSYNSKLSFEIIEQIQDDLILSKKKNIKKRDWILEKYKEYELTRDMLSDINCGETWFRDDLEYPLNDSSFNYRNFTIEEVKEIVKKIKNDVPFFEIAKQYGCNTITISKLNQGKPVKYKLADEIYPIKDTFGHLGISKITEIAIYMLNNDTMLQSEIADKFNVERKNISNINTGSYCKQLKTKFPNLKFPLKEYKEENLNILMCIPNPNENTSKDGV